VFFVIMSATKLCAGCKFEKALDEFKTSKGAQYDTCNKCFLANNKLFWLDKKFKVCTECKDKLSIEEAFTRDANGCPWPQCKRCYAERIKQQHRQKQRTTTTVVGAKEVEGK